MRSNSVGVLSEDSPTFITLNHKIFYRFRVLDYFVACSPRQKDETRTWKEKVYS